MVNLNLSDGPTVNAFEVDFSPDIENVVISIESNTLSSDLNSTYRHRDSDTEKNYKKYGIFATLDICGQVFSSNIADWKCTNFIEDETDQWYNPLFNDENWPRPILLGTAGSLKYSQIDGVDSDSLFIWSRPKDMQDRIIRGSAGMFDKKLLSDEKAFCRMKIPNIYK